MISTQIELTEEQSARLHEEAERAGCSVAELIRRSIDHFLEGQAAYGSERSRRLAAAKVAGLFRSVRPDVGERHDVDLDDVWSS